MMAERPPHLDQRSAQDLVDWAKRELIPRHCPQWTDHNVSDPGIALIEIFAAMVETLSYQVNRIPERVELRLLKLMGVGPQGPRQATVPLTFALSKAADTELTLVAGVEAATLRRPGEPEVVFTTRAPLTLYPAHLNAAQTHDVSQGAQGWHGHALRQGQLVGTINLFPFDPQQQQRRPDNGDALYLGFEQDLSNHLIALHLDCIGGTPRGLNPDAPPIVWQAHAPQDGLEWVPCAVEEDTTCGFSQPGIVRLHLPEKMDRSDQNKVVAYWIRCVIAGASNASQYQVSPQARSLRAETWGGTVAAEHAAVVEREELGRSDGSPGQVFHVRQRPLLRLDPDRDEVLVVEYEGQSERWVEVPDFGTSRPGDPHYVLDYITGRLTLGPTLLQPDGMLHGFGKVPPLGSRLRMQRYRVGGGLCGNVAAHELCVMKSARPYLARVWNREPASGGRDPQSIADTALRAPAALRSRNRAVTAEDFVQLAGAIPGVARAYCAAPGNQRAPAGPYQPPPPGKVRLAILPALDQPEIEAQIATERTLNPAGIRLSSTLRQTVAQTLKPLCPLGVSFDMDSVVEPALTWVRTRLGVQMPSQSRGFQRQQLERALRQALLRFLHPYCGGSDGRGWPFGRTLRVYDIVGAVQPLLGGGVIDLIELVPVDLGNLAQVQPAAQQVDVAPHGLICLYQVEVVVSQEA